MAKETILYGEVKFREKSISEDLTARLLGIDASGNLIDRPAVDTSSFVSTSLADGRVWIGSALGAATAVDTASVGDIDADSVNGLTIKAGTIVDADINGTAAIAYSKLTLTNSIVNADVAAAAAIAYSKLTLSNSIVNADIAAAAAIARTKVATGTAYRILANSSTGALSENAAITANRAVVSDANGQLTQSATTDTQIGYSSTLTGNIQTQLDDEIATKTVKAIVKAPTVAEHGYAITWDNTTGTWDLTDPVTQGIPLGGSTRQVLMKVDGTDWNADWNDLVLTDITDVSALAADLNLLAAQAAAGLTGTHLGHLIGVTSNIQSQLGNKLGNTLAQNALFVGNASNVASSLAAGTEGQVLSVTSGVPTWQTISVSGVTTIAGLDGTTKSANGAAVSGVNLYMQTADATYPGLVSTGTQTFAGAKSITATGVFNTTYQLSVNDAVRDLKLGVNSTGAEIQSFSVPLYLNPLGNNIILNSGGGSVGIGTTTPHAPLQFSNDIVDRKVVLYETADNDHQFYGFGLTSLGALRYQVQSTVDDHVFYAGTSSTTSDELMRLTGTGYLGIGTSTPHAPLQFANGVANRKVVLNEDGNNDHQFIGLGVNSGVFRYQVPSSVYDNVWYAGTSSTTSDELMRLTGAGNLGVGISSPSSKIHARLTATAGFSSVQNLLWLDAKASPAASAASGFGSSIYYTLNTTADALSLGNSIRLSTAWETIDTLGHFKITDGNFTDLFTITAGGQGDAYIKGKLGIGGAATYPLDVFAATGTARITSTGTGPTSLVLSRTAGTLSEWSVYTPAGSTDIKFYSGADRFSFSTGGVGTASNWIATSDRRIKSNIKKINEDVIEEIKKIGGLVSQYEKAGKRERGFIAQELLLISPEYVHVPEDPEQLLGVDYARMTALLFKGFQQLLNNGVTA